MKIEISLDTSEADDSELLKHIALFFVPTLEGATYLPEKEAPARTRAPRKAAVKPDPVAAYNALAEASGKPVVVTEENIEVLEERTFTEDEVVKVERVPADEQVRAGDRKASIVDKITGNVPVVEGSAEPVTDTRTRDELLKAARAKALDEGALWLRQFIKKFGVDSISELSDEALREILA